jgi:hypothetical protein
VSRILLYLILAVMAFFLATTGSDLFAQMTLDHKSLADALSEHFYWARVELVGTLMLFVPFVLLAAIASCVEKRRSRLAGSAIFGISVLFLIYCYFEGYQASKAAELAHHWTAAALSIGFLPFMALGVVLLTCVVGFLVVELKRKKDRPAPDRH